jgi:hypothetical protein
MSQRRITGRSLMDQRLNAIAEALAALRTLSEGAARPEPARKRRGRLAATNCQIHNAFAAGPESSFTLMVATIGFGQRRARSPNNPRGRADKS